MAFVLLPTIARPCMAALQAAVPRRDYVFFDERFHKARAVAVSWAASDRPIGVQGDITPVWTNELNRMTCDHRLRLRGVTTESFLFCLRILAGERANLEVQVERLDRNLLQWTIHTTPKTNSGTMPWPSLYRRV